MKKCILLVLSLVMLLSLCACGGTTSNEVPPVSAEEAIIGQWNYSVGLGGWNFIFNEDGSCKYWAANNESKVTTYKIEEDKIYVADLDDWEFYYTISEDEFKLFLSRDESDDWQFTKDITYDPSTISTLELTEEMIDDIEAKINSDTFETVFLLTEQAFFESDKEVTFTDLEISTQKKTSQYTYTVFGTVYAKDNYNDKYKQNVNIVFTAVEDEAEEKGYSIKQNTEYVE